MIEERIILVTAYVVIAALLLSFYFYTSFSKTFKASILILTSCFYFFTWHALEGLMGWPANQDMPSDFRILWINISEPDKENINSGEIFFWVKDLDNAGIPSAKPRAYSIEWSEENAKTAEEALKKMEEGEILNGNMSRNILTGDKKKSEGENYQDTGSLSGQEGEEPTFQFKEVASPTLPAKRPL